MTITNPLFYLFVKIKYKTPSVRLLFHQICDNRLSIISIFFTRVQNLLSLLPKFTVYRHYFLIFLHNRVYDSLSVD